MDFLKQNFSREMAQRIGFGVVAMFFSIIVIVSAFSIIFAIIIGVLSFAVNALIDEGNIRPARFIEDANLLIFWCAVIGGIIWMAAFVPWTWLTILISMGAGALIIPILNEFGYVLWIPHSYCYDLYNEE